MQHLQGILVIYPPIILMILSSLLQVIVHFKLLPRQRQHVTHLHHVMDLERLSWEMGVVHGFHSGPITEPLLWVVVA